MFRILRAEGEQVMRLYLARALERSGYEVVAMRAGASVTNAKVLAKPFHLEDLVLEVERLFTKECFGKLK
jgi:hypothetical protein